MRKVKVFYWDGMPNFGDALNPIIAQKLFNLPIETESPKKCEAVFIGSLLDDFLTRKIFFRRKKGLLNIWGTGFINDKNLCVKRPFGLPEKYFRTVKVFAVRGEFSKKRLENILSQKLDSCVLGDPGLLASRLIDISKIQKKYALGIIPHHIEIHGYEKRKNIPLPIPGLIPDKLELKIPVYQELKKKIPNSVIIDMEADPIEVIKRIAECEVILSSALHGLIVSDSLGIPNLWSSASNFLIGKDYKFKDYYSAYHLKKYPECLDLNHPNIDLKNIKNYIRQNYQIDIKKCEQIKKDLIACFPYPKERHES